MESVPFAGRDISRSVGRGCLASFLFVFILASPAFTGPITFGVFYEFSFTDVGVEAAGCDPADPTGGFCIPSSGTPTTFLDAPPWTFLAPLEGVDLGVTDAFTSGDQFEIFDFGTSLGLTSVPVPGADCGDDPIPCLAVSDMSSRTFHLSSGDHSITIIPALSPDGGGGGYLRVSLVPEGAAWSSLALGLVALLLHRRKSLRGAA